MGKIAETSYLKLSVTFYNVYCRFKCNLNDCNSTFSLTKYYVEVKPKF